MGYPVRALVHNNDDRSAKLAAKGVEIVVGDLLNFDDIYAAMRGVDTAYFCFPVLVPGVLQATAYFAQAAKEEGLKGIVNMSQISARREAKSNAAQDHWVGEQILNMTGIPIVHLRPTFFDDWFLYIRDGIHQNSSIVLPFGNGRWARQRNMPRVAGHRAGVQAVRQTVETCARLGVGSLTLYAFSVENWKRPRAEVETLWRLLGMYLRAELAEMMRRDIRFTASLLFGRCNVVAKLRSRCRRGARRLIADDGRYQSPALSRDLIDPCRIVVERLVRTRAVPTAHVDV